MIILYEIPSWRSGWDVNNQLTPCSISRRLGVQFLPYKELLLSDPSCRAGKTRNPALWGLGVEPLGLP